MFLAKRRRISWIDDDSDESNDAKENPSSLLPPPYLKLMLDCWYHVFDNLSIGDVLVMGETCKRMNRIAGSYIREYYPQLQFTLHKGIIQYQNVCLQPEFYPYIGRLEIRHDASAVEFLSNCQSFDALKAIYFSSGVVDLTQIPNGKNVLKNVEYIQVYGYHIPGNIFEQFANDCPKLRHIKVSSEDDDLFAHHFPMLEHLQLKYSPLKCKRIAELQTFLEMHTKLKQFETWDSFAWANRDILIETNHQLDLLKLYFGAMHSTKMFNEFAEFLRKLHERNFYKSLELSIPDWIFKNCDEQIINTIFTLPQLEKLTTNARADFNSNHLMHLKELNITTIAFGMNIETWATHLPILEQLYLCEADLNTIFAFLRHSQRLETIKIGKLTRGILDIVELCRERKTLEDACPTSIYVSDNDYLASKRRAKMLDLDLDLIKIKRFYFDEY